MSEPSARTSPPLDRRALVLPVAVAVGALALAAALAVANPSSQTIVICPLLFLTGFACPLCGGLRATADLVHGDVAGAWAMNPLWVAMIPLTIVAWADWLLRSWRGRGPRSVPNAVWIAAGIVVLVFGVLRNVPGLDAWLGPTS